MSHAKQINRELYQIKKELRNIQFHNQHMRLAACKLDVLQNRKTKCAVFFATLGIALWPLKKMVLNAMSFAQGNALATATTAATTTGSLTTATIIAVSPAPQKAIIQQPLPTVEKQIEREKPKENTSHPAVFFTPKTATIIKLDGEQITGMINNYTAVHVVIETPQGLSLRIEHKDIFKIMW